MVNGEERRPERFNRPASVTWLAVMVLVLSSANWLAVYGSLARWPLFSALSLTFPAAAVVALAGLWGAAWLVLAWGLLAARPWSRRALMVLLPAYQLITIGLLALFSGGDYERGRLSFVTGLAVLFCAAVIFILTRPRVRAAFVSPENLNEEPKEHDRRSED